eukprot:gnl/Spiro4/14667_TR7903_c0_g1_i1.p1 gnl/Spiro4/14667_TR7903_c0_g1~~gnl/Spiro4/14667_TR7903_c0_g1_i1.p1  ORF type:complete len:175 (+),score=15.33 gnl/Spiro4/14667_TR7903_c0_g1_i1:73-597(+)
MKIYRDVFTNEEIGSDSYPLEVLDDVVIKIEGKLITRTESEVDIGANPTSGNPDSEEAPSETYDANSVSEINVVGAARLSPTSFDKKSYMSYIRNYMKKLSERLKENNPSRVDVFQKNIQPFVKKVLEKFDDYSFYISETDYDMAGQVVLMAYGEDGTTPYFYYFKDGLDEEKV